MRITADEGRRYADVNPVYQSRGNTVPYHTRLDPLHEVTWRDGVNTEWRDVAVVRHVLDLTPSGTLIHAARRVAAPVDLPAAERSSRDAIRAVAALLQFYQMTTFQVAAHLDVPAPRAWRALDALHAYGVVDRAIPHWLAENSSVAEDRRHAGSGSLWRIRPDGARMAVWLAALSDLEYLLVTGGRDVSRGVANFRSATTVRHNLVATELMTRALEVAPAVVGAWGEAFTAAELFLPENQLRGLRANVADGALVTRDGRIILLELSGASQLDNGLNGERIQAKVAGWTAVAARSRMDLAVIFVDIAERPRPPRFLHHVAEGLRLAERSVADRAALARGRAAIFVADAHDWFPIALAVGAGFVTLEAYSPTTQRYHDLAPAATRLARDSDIVVNTLGALHTPSWVTRPVRSLLLPAAV